MNSENKKLVIFDFSGTLISTTIPFIEGEREGREVPAVLKEMIQGLSQKYTLVILSSLEASIIIKILEQESLDRSFTEIIGYNFLGRKSTKIKSLLSSYELGSDEAVFVTDTLDDLREGALAEVQTIGVTWGLDSEETLREGNPVAMISNPIDLASAIASVLK